MTVSAIFTRLEKLTQEEGHYNFGSLLTNLMKNKNKNESITASTDSYKLLRSFLSELFATIDDLATKILSDDTLLVSVRNQKLLRSCFQIISSIGISNSLIPGIGIPLSKRCSSAVKLPQMEFKDEEKYEMLVECTKFFTRCYKVPVLRSIIITFHLSDYLAALIQLAFAPLKRPGSYPNFVMTQKMYEKLSSERQQFVSTYENLVLNCFQPTLMRELLVLQTVIDPSPPAFAMRVIAKELSRRLLAPDGVLSLIRCLTENYNIDTGLEWKKMDMISRIVSTKHGAISEEDYLTNITSQLTKVLGLNNTYYSATAVACLLSLNEKYPESKLVKLLVKDVFLVFDYDCLVLKSSLPGTVILSPQDVNNKVNILHACVCTTKLDWPSSLLAPNLHILFLIGVRCLKAEDLKLKLKGILIKCLEKLTKHEISRLMNKWLLEKENWKTLLEIEEYDSGIAIKSASSQEKTVDTKNDTMLYFLDLLKISTNDELIKLVFEVSLDILIDLSVKRKTRANNDLLALEEDPILLDDTDEQYGTILQLLSEVSTSRKIISMLKTRPSIVINFVEHFILSSNHKADIECTTIALVLLNTVLSNTKKNDGLENRFISIMPVLKKMSQDESNFNHILCKEALSLMSSDVRQQPESAFGKAVSDTFDNLLPVKAHGIIELTKLIDAKDAETISKKHYVFCIFQEQLKDPDSYIYLSAINGLSALGTHCTEEVLHILCKEFLQLPTDQSSLETNDEHKKSAELRMKIGDVIVKVIQRLGEMAIVHKTVLLNTMLCGCRDDDPFIRASALSNLAEIARVLHYKIGTIIHEVLLCIWSILETDNAVECRRAAVMVITSLIKGLGKETLVQLKENLLPIYRTLKTLYKDDSEDTIVRLHAQLALEELNDVVNQFIFPELKMEKQIFVLDKPEEEFK